MKGMVKMVVCAYCAEKLRRTFPERELEEVGMKNNALVQDYRCKCGACGKIRICHEYEFTGLVGVVR